MRSVLDEAALRWTWRPISVFILTTQRAAILREFLN
jgi:hypothetical protein